MKKLICIAVVIFAGCSKQVEKTDLTLVGQQGGRHFFSLSKPWIDDMEYVEGEAKSFCSSHKICQAHFWETGTAAPKSLPFSDEQVATELVSYRVNRHIGAEAIMWRCERYPKSTTKNCFR